MMPEEAPPEAAPEEGATGETASIPASIVGGQEVSPGDVIRLEVVSTDGETITVKYAQPEATEEAAPKKGVEGMAAEFD